VRIKHIRQTGGSTTNPDGSGQLRSRYVFQVPGSSHPLTAEVAGGQAGKYFILTAEWCRRSPRKTHWGEKEKAGHYSGHFAHNTDKIPDTGF
jgi:hypothetical protein